MTMKLLDLYQSILDVAMLKVSEDGFVSAKLMGESKPAMVKGKRLVLPTREHLSSPDWEHRVRFHPLAENVLRAESDVLAFFRQSLNIRLNFTFGVLAYQLLQIATSPADHAKLSPDQAEFLSKVKNADEKTLQVYEKLIAAYPANASFVSIYLKRTGQIAGKRYARLGVVSFPIYKDLKASTTGEVNGVKMRVKDRESILALLEYMIPSIEDGENNNRGSDSQLAPFLDALMKSVLVVASPLNALVELFRNQLEEPEELMINDEWVETFENLGVLKDEIRAIPMQAGNEGSVPGMEAAAAAPASVAAPAVAAPPVVAAAPAGMQPGSISSQLFGQPAPVAPPMQPVYGGYAPGAGYPSPTGYPAPHMHPQAGHPGYPPPHQPAPPPADGRPRSFNEILASNPALGAQVGHMAYGRGPAGYPQQPVQRPPSWASPQQVYGGPAPMGYGAPRAGYQSTL